MANQPIRLTDAPRALAALGITVSYLQIWRRAIAGTIPAFRIKSRWYVHPENLPSIAAALSSK